MKRFDALGRSLGDDGPFDLFTRGNPVLPRAAVVAPAPLQLDRMQPSVSSPVPSEVRGISRPPADRRLLALVVALVVPVVASTP